MECRDEDGGERKRVRKKWKKRKEERKREKRGRREKRRGEDRKEEKDKRMLRMDFSQRFPERKRSGRMECTQFRSFCAWRQLV